jgi:hypothetical protein
MPNFEMASVARNLTKKLEKSNSQDILKIGKRTKSDPQHSL